MESGKAQAKPAFPGEFKVVLPSRAATGVCAETIEARTVAVAGGSSRNGSREPFDRAEP